jgi:membrane-bound lytic murein transglycosylase D
MHFIPERRPLHRCVPILAVLLALESGCALVSPPRRSGDPYSPPPVAASSPSAPSPEPATPDDAPPPPPPAPEAPASPAGAERIASEPVVAPEFPVVVNARVEAALRAIVTHKSVGIAQAFARARRYAPMMRRIFEERGLPAELVNLAFVESGVNPRATSRAKAAGIWQFVPSTARSYGMRSTKLIDERRDPEKSTRAAAAYLARLHGRFNSWPLALAAYNAGEGSIQRAIARQRTTDFWRLRLRKETERFVPNFMAMTLISRDPRRYGFSPPPEEPHETELLYVSQPTEIQQLAAAAGTSVQHLRELNPELIGGATPSDGSHYLLRIPRRFTWVAHKTQRGETIERIARRYAVSPHLVREANKLGEAEEPKAGTVILVPVDRPPA